MKKLFERRAARDDYEWQQWPHTIEQARHLWLDGIAVRVI